MEVHEETYFMLSLLIPGPKAPGNQIDVFLQPLIEELKELWEIGVETYDASKKQNFQLHTTLLWTIMTSLHMLIYLDIVQREGGPVLVATSTLFPNG